MIFHAMTPPPRLIALLALMAAPTAACDIETLREGTVEYSGGDAVANSSALAKSDELPLSSLPAEVDFDLIKTHVLAPAGCTSSYCHGGVLDDRDTLVNVAAGNNTCEEGRFVMPGKPEESLLWLKVAPGVDVCGDKMPLDQPALSDDQLDLLYAWIQSGAR